MNRPHRNVLVFNDDLLSQHEIRPFYFGRPSWLALFKRLHGDVRLKRHGVETSCWWSEWTGDGGVQGAWLDVRRTYVASRAWRLNRSRSLISADFDDRRCVSGSASQCACSARAQSTCCGGGPPACCAASTANTSGRYFVVDRSGDWPPVRDQYGIGNHSGADSNIRSASACFHSNR